MTIYQKWINLSLFLILFSFTANSQVCTKAELPTNLQTGLVGFYPFCGNANDVSGNNVNGVVTGATLTTDRYGSSNNAYSLNGTNQYITIPDANSFNDFTTQFSISIWIRPSTGNTYGQIIGKWGFGGSNLAAWALWLNSTNQLTALVHYPSTNSGPSNVGTSITNNNWHHIVYTFKNSVTRIYVDGTLITTHTGTHNQTQNSNYALDIGREANFNYNYYKGSVDDVILYNRELTACEARQLYQSTSATSSAGTLSGTQTICIGGTTTFSSTVSGGTWSSSDPTIASVASSTGVITGVSAGTATITYTITGCTDVTSTRTVTVSPNNTAGVASSTPTLCINTALTNFTHTTTGATGIGTATGLPAGITAAWASNTITISGTPTQSGAFSYSIPLTGGCGSVNATGTITVTAANTVGAASSTPTLCINTALTNITHTTTGATGIGTATGLPTGVTAAWASNRVTISGTPTQSGTFNYSIPLTGGCGSVNATGTITVTAANTAGVASSTPILCINTALTNITHTTTGATGIGTATGLPAGVTAAWASNRVTISGTPTQSGTFNYSIPLTGGCGSVNATGTITVTAANTVGAASSIPTLCINTALTNITHTTTGATGIGTATGLPTGVTAAWASNRITISGTPTQSGTFSYTIPLTGGCGSVNATGTITVTAANTVGVASSTPTLCTNTALTNITHTTTGATGIGTATGLPTGVTAAWASNRITISGTPTQSGTFSYSIPLTGGCGSVNATGTITVTARPVAGTLDGNQEICALGSTTFTSTNAGGSWSSSDNTIATIDATTGVIAGIAAGTATITYTMVGTGGCTNATATRTVTVTAIPTTGTLSGTQAICVGGSSTFSSTVTGGSWLSSDNTIATIDATTGVIAGIAAGTATMTYTIIGTGGCADVSATRALTVTAPPTAGLLSGPQDICVLGTTFLTSTVAGGTWTSSSAAISTINTTTGVATGVGAGIATMTYTVAGTGGCANVSATRTVTVTAAPTSGTLSGTQSICVSSSVIFSSSSAGGSWTSSNSLIATINSATGAVSGVAPGTATMTYIVPGTGGCANASATRIVTVTAAPNAGTLTGSQEICVGGTTTLSSSVTGGSWSSSAGTVATINGTSGFVVGMTPGNTTMTYTILGTGGCANAIATRIVTVTAPPVAGTLTGAQGICVNGTTTFNSTVTGGTWTSSNGSIATINASTGLITGVTAGTAIMTYTILGTGGCANATASRIVTVTAPPSAGTLSGVQAICIAGTSLFSSSVVGGNWASSDNTIATINSATGSISGLAAGTVGMTYTVLGTGGCADVSATRTLTVTAPPVAGTLSGTQSICINATTVLSSTIAGGTWTSSDNTIAVVNAASGIVTGIAAGNATMTYTVAGSGGCANVTATRTVTINPNNTVGQASSTPTLCINTPLLPSITHLTTGATDIGLATGLPAGVTASWSNNRITISGAPTVAGTFNYSIPLTGGCGTTAAVGTIIVNPTNTVTVASSSPTLCINTPLIPITHTTTGATDIGVPVGLPAGVVATWLSGVITITGTPTTAGTYNYSIPLVGGCGNLNATGVIIVAPQPVGSISSSTTLLCDGGTVSLTATGGTTYQWYLNGGIIVGATGSSIAANQPGTYTANVISSFGCVTPAAGSITLQLVRKPIVNFTYDKYCAGFPTLFTDQSNVANSNVVTYSWNFGQGQGTSTLQNPTNTYSNPGNYSASLTITPVACPVLATTFTKTVTIIAPPPNQRYSSLNAVENRDLQLNARVFGLAQYSWAPSSGLSSASIVSPIFNYNQQVDYVVTITTPVGCVLKDSILVRIFKEKEIFVPKGFSPNGDGKNDKIFPRLVGVRDLIYFKIFNRWGQLIFQTSVLGEGWDGKVRGVLQPMESYVWVAEGVDIDNNIIKRTGTFLLVR